MHPCICMSYMLVILVLVCVCIYIYIYINRMLLYHCVTSSTYFQHLLFLFKLFYSLFSKKKKKKKILSLLVHTITLPQTFLLPLCLFIFPLFSTLLLHFFRYFIFLIFFTLPFPILFCINLVSFIPFNPFFSYKKYKCSLSLSLSLITLI